jgi:DNA-binding LacI/PurR family transcriptional regulator
MERSRRWYFLLLGVVCVFGWSTGLWAVPLVGFALIEGVWTAAEHLHERGHSRRLYVR